MWGQLGEFLIMVNGVRAVVEVDDGFGQFRIHLGFHAVDPAAPFISETGFRSHFDYMQPGDTVDNMARAVFAEYLAEQRRPLAQAFRASWAAKEPRPWLGEALPYPAFAERAFEDKGGQMAFGF